jgi:hypothetical protein
MAVTVILVGDARANGGTTTVSPALGRVSCPPKAPMTADAECDEPATAAGLVTPLRSPHPETNAAATTIPISRMAVVRMPRGLDEG